jgi:hypothetical protein
MIDQYLYCNITKMVVDWIIDQYLYCNITKVVVDDCQLTKHFSISGCLLVENENLDEMFIQ